MRVNDINSRIESILDEIKIGTAAKKVYNLMIRKILMLDNKIHQRPVDRVQADIAQCEARIRKLEDGYADESIDLEMLNKGLKRYRGELKLLKGKRNYQGRSFDLSAIHEKGCRFAVQHSHVLSKS